MKKLILLLGLSAVGLLGQSTPPAPVQPVSTPSTNWYGAGAAFNPSATPEGSGWAAYAKQLNAKAGLWQFNIYFAGPERVAGKTTIVESTSAGFAIAVKALGPFQVFGFGTAGMASSGSSVGNAFPWGGFVDYRIKQGAWHIDAGYMLISSSLPVSTQRVYMLGVGRVF